MSCRQVCVALPRWMEVRCWVRLQVTEVRRRSRLANESQGLAVSGGVDSMALATLCRDLRATRRSLGLRFKALVLDHDVREGSAAEASEVAARLSNMG